MYLEGLEPQEVAQLVPARPVLVTYRGSIAHGMYVAPHEPTGIDDKDIIVAYVPPLEAYFGLRGDPRGKDSKVREWDCAAYELRHLFRLLLNCNPNVMAMLWVAPEHIIHMDREGQALIDNRDLFASQLAFNSFCGYARGQLHRMTNHGDAWIDDYVGRGSRKLGATGFMGEKRKALVLKHGYDTKNAAHLIRLLRMGREFLQDGRLYVDRSFMDADELLAIKRGEWSIEKVQDEARRLFEDVEAAKIHSPLPEEPDRAAVETLLVRLLSVAKNVEVALETMAFLRPLEPVLAGS